MAEMLLSFHDFQIATQHIQVTNFSDLQFEGSKNTYALKKMLADADLKKVVQGGSKMRNEIIGSHGSTYGSYRTGQEESPQGSDGMVKTETAWSFNRAYYTYDAETTDYNEGDKNRWRSLKRKNEIGLMYDIADGMEDQLFATPNKATMEDYTDGGNGNVPYSLMCFNTRDGGVPTSSNGGVVSGSGDWTTALGLSDVTNEWWKNQSVTYDATTPDDPDNGLIKAFASMCLRTRFEMPTADMRYNDPKAKSMRKQKILTNEDGHTFYEVRLRGVNDKMRIINDPHIGDLQYKGIPIEYVSNLDNAGWTTGQPDYKWFNFNYLYPVFKSQWFMRQTMTDGGSSQPNRKVVWKWIHWNLTCESRRRQGTIYHAAA